MKTICYKIIFEFLLFFLLLSGLSLPQNNLVSDQINTPPGFPIIKNYLPKEYKAHNQNWAIVKDKRGIMYFGNSSGVLEYDGQNWNLVKVTNGIVRSMCVDDNGTIFIGAADDLGYLVRDTKNATLHYKSLIPVSYTHLRAHETVLDLVCRLLLEKKKNKQEKKKKKK